MTSAASPPGDLTLQDLARELARRLGTTVDRATELAVRQALERLGGAPGSEAAPDATAPGDGVCFHVSLFGHPQIRRVAVDGAGQRREEALTWRLRRAFQVVAYLALAPDRRASKEELVEAIWRDAAAVAVERNFHPTLSDVRKTLAGAGPHGGPRPDHLPLRDGVYVLDPAATWRIDVDAFHGELRAAEGVAGIDSAGDDELEALRRAWRLVRGPLLVGHEAPWVAAARDRLHRRWLDVLRRIGSLAGGDDARPDRLELALDAWRRLLIEEPFEEPAHVAVMELYARRGRRDLVRRQYVKLQDHLAEIDVEPTADTQERYLRLMR
jgi:DNA-binding SARP family transcriptional activator